MPKDNNPSKGWIATANHRVHATNNPNPLTADWHTPYRQNRTEALLLNQEKHDVGSMKDMQADALSLSAIDLLSLLQQANSTHKYANDTKGLMASFNGNMSIASPGATIYNAWAHQLTRLLLDGKLGSSFTTEYGKRDLRSGVYHIMELHLAGKHDAAFWCDQSSTPEIESCEQIINLAFTRALDDFSK